MWEVSEGEMLKITPRFLGLKTCGWLVMPLREKIINSILDTLNLDTSRKCKIVTARVPPKRNLVQIWEKFTKQLVVEIDGGQGKLLGWC